MLKHVEGPDEVLGGGLPDKSVVLMMGEPGSGHDIPLSVTERGIVIETAVRIA